MAVKLIPIGADAKPESPIPDSAMASEMAKSFVEFYKLVGYEPPWVGYIAVEQDQCVGTCSFKGPPSGDRVEIAYFTFPEFEGIGVATRMAKALVRIALTTDPDLLVAAQTLPQEGPSTAVLRKLGFERSGTVQHPDDGAVWEWHLEDR